MCCLALSMGACVDPEGNDAFYEADGPYKTVEELKAFPTAEGFGKNATGGRGGQVVYVTSTADDGSEGTLRWALKQYPKDFTVVFAVGGTIELQSDLRCKAENFTIAGQTAPGDGICITKNEVNFGGSKNFIIRHLRFRPGDKDAGGADLNCAGLRVENADNFIVDHCSFSWTSEENADFIDTHFTTVQYCIFSEGLYNSVNGKGARSYGGVFGGSSATYHHNLLANNNSRTPLFNGARGKDPGQDLTVYIEYINNVNYNWGSKMATYGAENESQDPLYPADGTDGYQGNFVNNYYKPGPATKSVTVDRIFSPNGDDGAFESNGGGKKGTWGVFHLAGNVFDGSAIDPKYQDRIDAVNANNWVGLQPETKNGIPLPGGKQENIQSGTEFLVSTDAAEYTQSAQDAYEWVLKCAGASLKRDAVDARIVDEVRQGITHYTGGNTPVGEKTYPGIIDRVSDTDGWPTYQGTALKDTDHDGMPDSWEREKGLDPNKDDSAKYNLSKEYTNLEVYMNGLVEALYPAK